MLPRVPQAYGHLAYSQALLKSGRLREGWQQYEFRFLCEPSLSQREAFGRPTWSGQDLRGKTILLLAEQGLGDTIHFVRFAPRVKALGANVLLRVPVGFGDFAKGFSGIDKVIEVGAPLVEFDYYLNLMSLPRIFDLGLASIQGETPYLHAEPDVEKCWAARLKIDDTLAVGLVWAGNPNRAADRHRSISLTTLAPLGEIAGVRLYALQKGAREEEALRPPPGMEMENLGPELRDFRDTAAVLNQLDLVISVDTAVAHLAGALGKPVWLMLSDAPCWRWLRERDDSPWYPTMRLFRQSQQGDWGGVVEQVRRALQDVIGGGGPLSPLSPRDVSSAQSAAAVDPPGDTRCCTGLSAVAHTRAGFLQYLPGEQVEGDCLRMYGEVLQPQIDLLAKLVQPGATVIEICPGIGTHAIPLAKMVGATGHLLLYEARPVQQQILRQNLSAHRIAWATVLRRIATGSDVVSDATSGKNLAGGIPTESIDDLELERIDLIKVNAGVAPAKVLAGAANTLWRSRPLLFMAMDDRQMLKDAGICAREFGYRCWRMDSPLFNPRNFNHCDANVFSNRTAVALVAIPEEMEGDLAQFSCVELS